MHQKVKSPIQFTFALYDRRLCQIENKVENIQSETAKIVQLQKELMQLMKQHQKKNYSLGDDGFDVRP